MLSTDQIRTLNDARSILRGLEPPRTWEGGFALAAYRDAEQAVFQALNVSRSYLGDPITDDLMHNREGDTTRNLGRADNIEVDGMEDGFELHLSTDQGSYVVNVHGVARQLLEQVVDEVGGWYAEAEAARTTRPVFACDPDESGGYDTSDPKHENWHSVHASLYDSREGK